MYDIEQKKMLKHVCTRWLSIGRCLNRLLHNWDPLKVFFAQEHEKLHKVSQKASEYTMSKVEGIFNCLKSPTNRLTTLLLYYSVKVFDEALLPLQAEDPKIHVL